MKLKHTLFLILMIALSKSGFGQCTKIVYTPPKEVKETYQKLVSPRKEVKKVIQEAKYTTRKERIKVSNGYMTYELRNGAWCPKYIEPVFKEIEITIELQPQIVTVEVVPAVYETLERITMTDGKIETITFDCNQ